MGLDITGIGALSNLLQTSLEKIFPDKEKVAAATNALITPILGFVQEAVKAQVSVIIAESQGESWLQRNWRPITMLTFVVLIVSHWFGYSAPNLTEAERIAIFDLVKLGLGGYVMGRSAEKVAESLAPALSAKWGKN